MSNEDITRLIRRVQSGRDEEATRGLWNTYFARLAKVAAYRLGKIPRREADEEDVAVSALHSFFAAVEDGQFQDLHNRDELWRVLVTITVRKVNRQVERGMAKKRGGGTARGESAFWGRRQDQPQSLDEIPDERAINDLVLECRERLEHLPEAPLRQIAMLRLSGWEIAEIAKELGVSTSTVKRKIRRIRAIWSETDGQDIG